MPADNTEGLSHKELHALVSGARPGDLSTRGDSISVAARKIFEIVNDLDRLVKKAEWKGESGDALRTWARGFAKEGRQLGEFATLVSNALHNAGSGLSDAKTAMPKPKPGGHPSTGEGTEKDRQEALTVITRLNSYYREAAADVARPTRPNFTPLGGIEDPRLPEPPRATSAVGGEQSSAVLAQAPGVGGDATYGGTGPRPGPASPPDVPPSPSSRPEVDHQDRAVQTNLDSVAVDNQSRTSVPAATSPTQSSSATVGSQGQGAPFAATAPVRGNASGSPTGSGRLSAPGMPVGQRPASVPTAASPLRTPQGGVQGGTVRPAPTGPTQAGMPRGTVIGGEQRGNGRPPVGAPHNFGAGSGRPAQTGPTTSRRLASDPGGVAGGSRSGVVNGQSASRTSGAAQGSASAQTPNAGRASTTRSNNDRNRRVSGPEYLRENRETWNRGKKKTVPPVIDS